MKAEEPRVKPRLSDAGEDEGIIDQSDVESVKSEASEKNLPQPEPPMEVLAPAVCDPVTPKPPTPMARLPKRFVPKYKGPASVLSIQLFCVDERFEMRFVLSNFWDIIINLT